MKLFTFFQIWVKNTKHVRRSLIALFWVTIVFAGMSIMKSCQEDTQENTFIRTPEIGELSVSYKTNHEFLANMTFGDTRLTYFTQASKPGTQTGRLDDVNVNAIESNFQVRIGNTVVYNTTFELDTTVRHYRLLQHKKIEQIAKSLSDDLTKDDYVFLSTRIEALIHGIISNAITNNGAIDKISLQSLFFHKAILNAKKREEQTGVLECLPSPFYITGVSFYTDIKDINVPKEALQNLLKSHPEIKDDKGVPELNVFANTLTSDNTSFDKVYFLFADKQQYINFLDNAPNKTGTQPVRKPGGRSMKTQGVAESECECDWWCVLGCGCDLGCCGNYEGCCLYNNPICLLHDVLCICCFDLDVCFSGCVKDPSCDN